MTLAVRILGLTALLALVCTLSAYPVAALDHRDSSARRARHVAHARSPQSSLRKRTSPKCKSRPTSISQSSSTSQAASVKSPAPAPPAPKPASNPKSNPAPASSNNNGGSGGSGKIGLAWYEGNNPNIKNVVNSQVHSYYTWSPNRVQVADDAGLEFLPQLWGRDNVAEFKKVAAGLNAQYYLGFNECNEVGQSNMSPQEAIGIWKDAMNPLKAMGKKLVCPAMSSRPNGLDWVKTFLNDPDVDCDVIALHWYDNTPEKLITYVNLWHTTFPDKPIWITEFAFQNFNSGGQPSLSDIQTFMRNATAWLDSQPFVERYMPFGWGSPLPGGVNPDNALLTSGGQLTTLGHIVVHSG